MLSVSSAILQPEQEINFPGWWLTSAIIMNKRTLMRYRYVPRRCLLDLRGINSVLRRTLEPKSEFESEEETYSSSAI